MSRRRWISVESEFRAVWARSRIPPGSRVLDVGAFEGLAAALYADGPAAFVAACDPLEEAIRRASERSSRVRTVVSVGERLPFRQGAFDVVSLLEVIEHVDDERRVLDEIHRVLRPEGLLLLTTINRGPFGFLDLQAIQGLVRRVTGTLGERFHHHYSARSLVRLLRPNFQTRSLERPGFVLTPMSVLLGMFDGGRLSRTRARMLGAEDGHDFGPFGYLIRIVARRA